jgi:hypothetical protein
MYIDLIVIIVIVLALIMYFRHFSAFVFSIAIVDILLRILTFIRLNIGKNALSAFLNKYIPVSIPGIITKYTTGTIADILVWIYVIIMIIFLYYVIKIWFKKKKF